MALSQNFDLKEIAAKIRAGERISRAEGIAIYREMDLPTLGQLASYNRAKFSPTNRATYLIDRNINYTNVCNTDCQFCGFYRADPKHPEAYVLTKEQIGKKIEEALKLGATRILLQGGHNDELPFEYYTDLIGWIHQSYPIELNAFSPSEITQISKVSSMSIRDVLLALQAAGMRGLPGGGAEMLDDDIRQRVSPKKISADQWIQVTEIAHSLGLTTTASMVIGFGESIEQRLNHFDRVRDLQARSIANGFEGFNAFISWPLQSNENTSLGRSKRASTLGASATEYLKNLAFSRIYLDNIPHIQSSWPTCGPEVAGIGLQFGADDFGSTMMEENVVSQAGAPSQLGCSLTPEELQYHIRRAGFIPAQRDSSFNIVKSFTI